MLENLDYIPTPWGNAAKYEGSETAPLGSPNFTGIPTAPTAAPDTNTTQIATTEFVTYAITLTGITINDHINLTSAHGATSSNTASRIVLRDENGDFSAGTITANLTGVASEAIKLQTARNINGIPFDGTTDITIATGVPSVNIETNYNVPDLTVGKSILIRKISAYNGTAITISPPFGATFEGLASLPLYGQYSFVELERISSTVFAIKDREDEYSIVPELRFGGESVGIVYSIQSGFITIKGPMCIATALVRTTSKGTSNGAMTLKLAEAPKEPAKSNMTATLDLAGVSYNGQYAGYLSDNIIYFENTSSTGELSPLTNFNANDAATYRVSVVYSYIIGAS